MTNAHEDNIFVDVDLVDGLSIEEYLSLLLPLLDNSVYSTVSELYANFTDIYDTASDIMGDAIFVCPSYGLVHAFEDKGRKGLFAIPPAYHGDDLGYYLPSLSLGVPPYNNSAFDTAFVSSFFNFALANNPNMRIDVPSIIPFWPTWSNGSQEMLFNCTEDFLPDIHAFQTADIQLERCR
ncbi:hypothetical protein FISHEDRAFT_79009 [Fistulina hepatica ATCC 64428]|uniref:Alpha/beta-hydrolase n=1 Tax=Fistulina hepatica ATCC 64428 TaxID=1128425 RepID=A0A0D7A0M6_9AGAR|nr:hypothetical protein FISHEDRAFT_79009 [Fistulina hepatica ATCC 64428]